jgi:hypothetical protein
MQTQIFNLQQHHPRSVAEFRYSSEEHETEEWVTDQSLDKIVTDMKRISN